MVDIIPMIRKSVDPQMRFGENQIVFAKCQGFKPWPAVIAKVEYGTCNQSNTQEYIYKVKFIGDQSSSWNRGCQLQKLNKQTVNKFRKKYKGTTNLQEIQILKNIDAALRRRNFVKIANSTKLIEEAKENSKIKDKPPKIKRQRRTKMVTRPRVKMNLRKIKSTQPVQKRKFIKKMKKMKKIKKIKSRTKVELSKPKLQLNKADNLRMQRKVNRRKNFEKAKVKKKKLQNKKLKKKQKDMKINSDKQEKKEEQVLDKQAQVKQLQAKQKQLKRPQVKKAQVKYSPIKWGLKTILLQKRKFFKYKRINEMQEHEENEKNNDHQSLSSASCSQNKSTDDLQKPNGLQIFQQQVHELLSGKRQEQEVLQFSYQDSRLPSLLQVPVNQNKLKKLERVQTLTVKLKPQAASVFSRGAIIMKKTLSKDQLKKHQSKQAKKASKSKKKSVKNSNKLFVPEDIQKMRSFCCNCNDKQSTNDQNTQIQQNNQIQQFRASFSMGVSLTNAKWILLIQLTIKLTTFITQMKDSYKFNQKARIFSFKQRQALVGMFESIQSDLVLLIKSRILDKVYEFLRAYECAQNIVKQCLQIQYQYFLRKLQIYRKMLEDNIEKLQKDAQRKAQLKDRRRKHNKKQVCK